MSRSPKPKQEKLKASTCVEALRKRLERLRAQKPTIGAQANQ